MSLATQSSKLLLALSLAALSFGCERGIRQAGAGQTQACRGDRRAASHPERRAATQAARGLPQRVEQKVGTLAKPCLGEGDSRMMEVKYTGKTTDEGPKFSVTNKSNSQLLFGSVAARS